jgi:molybdopterin molybdotransferase
MSVGTLLSLTDALAAVLARCEPLPPELLPLDEAASRVLAERVVSTIDLPPFPSSAMDGFALRAEDTPGTLDIVFRIAAGRPAGRPLGPGEAMGIATGGVVPEGADAVVPIEAVADEGTTVEVPVPVPAMSNVRAPGRDVERGSELAPAGTPLTAARIAALAAAGVARVHCARRPRAAVLTTGTELRSPGEELRPGEVYEANGAMLAAQLRNAGAIVDVLPAVEDDVECHREAIAAGLEHDVLVTSGGVSVGPHDLVRSVEAELGVEEVFWGVAVRPGKPVSFGVRGETLVFGLPGNPVSSFVACELFVKPALGALQGALDPGPHYEVGRITCDVRRGSARDTLVRARSSVRDDGTWLDPVDGQESHMIARAATADTLVLVERGEGVAEAGSPVRYVRTA